MSSVVEQDGVKQPRLYTLLIHSYPVRIIPNIDCWCGCWGWVVVLTTEMRRPCIVALVTMSSCPLAFNKPTHYLTSPTRGFPWAKRWGKGSHTGSIGQSRNFKITVVHSERTYLRQRQVHLIPWTLVALTKSNHHHGAMAEWLASPDWDREVGSNDSDGICKYLSCLSLILC